MMFRTVVLVSSIGLCVGASACAPVEPKSIGEQCSLTSDCDAPLVCRTFLCRVECSTSRDCAAGLDCVFDNHQLGGCQLPTEAHCNIASDCPDPLVCTYGECTNMCTDEGGGASRDCPPGSRCWGTCLVASPPACNETTPCPTRQICLSGRCLQLCIPGATGTETGACMAGVTCSPGSACLDPDDKPCVYNTDCETNPDDPRVCAPDQRCRDECLTNRDCRYGTTCEHVDLDSGGVVNFCQFAP